MNEDARSDAREPRFWSEEDLNEALRRAREAAHEEGEDEQYRAGYITGAEHVHRVLLDQHAGTPE